MTALWTKKQCLWSPTGYWTVEYEYQRSGADMKYRFYWKVWLNTSTSWYYNGLQLRLFVNDTQYNIKVKGYNSGETGWSYDGTTDWYTVSNKTSGSVSFKAVLYDTNTKTTEATESNYSLTVAPAQATITFAPDFNDEENPTIEYSNPAGTNVTELKACISLDGSMDDIKYRDIEPTGTKYTFKLSEDERNLLRVATTANSRKVMFFVRTKIGGSELASIEERTLTIVNADPTFTAEQLSYSDRDDSIVNVTNNPTDIIAGKSSLQIGYTAATGNKGATISKYEFTLNGVTKTTTSAGGTVGFGKILTSKDLTLTVKVTDSRGNSVTVEKNIPFILYSDPVIALHPNFGEIICKRCNEDGAFDPKGERLKLAVRGKWNTLPSKANGARLEILCVSNNFNSGWLPIEVEQQGGDEANNYIAWYDVNTKVEGLTINKRTIYTISIRICDDLTPEDKAPTITVKIPTSAATFHLSKNGLRAAFGMYAQRNKALQIAEDWTLDVLGDMEIRGKKLLDYFQPIKSICTLTENTNPATEFGGEWQLIDKEFSSIATDGTTEYFTPASGVDVVSVFWSRGGHDIAIRLGLKINAAMNDNTLSLGSLNWSKFGVDGLHFGWNAITAYSDNANGGIMCNIAWDTGEISQIDVIDTESISSGNTFYFDLHLTFSYARMLDEACNRFYWERVK